MPWTEPALGLSLAPPRVATEAPRAGTLAASERRRHTGVELGRSFAMLAIVMAHVPPPAHLSAWLRPFAEFSVPYFFVVSGYFLGAGGGSPGARSRTLTRARGLLRKVLGLYAGWFVVYALVPLDWLTPLRRGDLGAALQHTRLHSASALREAPLQCLLDGPPGGFHLWFLPALASAVALLALAVRFERVRLFGLLALGLFALGLIGGRYVDTALGVPLGLVTRNGPFQSALLVGLGYALSTRGTPRVPWLGAAPAPTTTASLGVAAFVLALGFALLAAEGAWLRAATGALPDAYSLAAPVLGVGAFLAFHHLPAMSPRAARVTELMGSTTLGVYLVHILLRVPLASVFGALDLYPADGGTPWWGFLALFAVSVALVLATRCLRACVRERWARASA